MKSWLLPEQTRLTEQINTGSLPHAMLICGVKGAGKTQLALWLAQALICQQSGQMQQTTIPCGQCKACHLFSQHTHPDHLFIEAEGNSIGVEQIRAVSRFFEKTAQLGRNQVVVIQGAEQMTESAANALLKTLEEPTANSFLLLLACDSQHLLPTIISRCRQLQLRPPVGDTLLSELGQTSHDDFVNLSHLAELTDQQSHQQFIEITQQFMRYLFDGQQRMALFAQLEQNSHSLRWLEKVTVDLVRCANQWREMPEFIGVSREQLADFAKHKAPQIAQIYQLINDYNRKVAQYSQFNQTLALEKLLVDIQLTITS